MTSTNKQIVRVGKKLGEITGSFNSTYNVYIYSTGVTSSIAKYLVKILNKKELEKLAEWNQKRLVALQQSVEKTKTENVNKNIQFKLQL